MIGRQAGDVRHPTLTVEPWPHGDAVDAAARLRGRPHLVWLDSALPHQSRGRWSIVASDPRWVMTARGSEVTLRDATGVRHFAGDPLAAFAAFVEAEPPPSRTAALAGLPFAGGAVGYLGFELARFVERLPATTLDDLRIPDLAMAWYDAAFVWDGVARAGWLVGVDEAVRALRGRLRCPIPPRPSVPRAAPCELRSNFTRSRYLDAVRSAQRYIEAGDIYQVNLSQRFSVPVRGEGFDLYRRLREVSPASFAAYLDFRSSDPRDRGVEVLSSSPERMLLLDGDRLETRPIKGTRRRGPTPAEDARQVEALLASGKDAAEHVMIVDLERNDLGRVAEVGSVCVEEFAALESFAQVHHLTSTITARRRPGLGLDATLRAVFPGGSITGAPKVRALEIIDELEPTARGVYTGAVGYVSAHGRADLSIAIRTITLTEGMAHLHVGGAIVADSDPAAEYQETLDKARGMAHALGVRLPDEPALAGADAAS
ncbi:MAG: aminodeoxychorismate synthase component I [Dehalococcoidia bacterium]